MIIIKKPIQFANIIDRQGTYGVFDTMEDAIRLADSACEEYSKYSLSRKSEIIDAIIAQLELNLENLSLMTYKETGCESYDDILYNYTIALNNAKNNNYLDTKLSTNNRMNNLEDSRSVNGIIDSECNSVECLIKNSILMLKAGNTVVFASNKGIKDTFAYAVKLINKAIESIDGPKNLIVTVKEPNLEDINAMIKHEKITIISAADNYATEKIAL